MTKKPKDVKDVFPSHIEDDLKRIEEELYISDIEINR